MDYTRPQPRPQSKSGFSFKSDRSSSTNKSHKRKETLVETPAEKRRTHMSETTKANPNAAINELQPAAQALERGTLGSLSSSLHNDAYGRPITEPDLSNPTRSRWERPLDTIRSFEAAIDGEYRRRQSMYRADTAPEGSTFQSARNSYYWGNANGSAHDVRASQTTFGRSRESYMEQNGYGPPPIPPQHRYAHRQPSDPALGKYGNNSNVYSYGGSNQPSEYMLNRSNGPGFHPENLQSRDTINTGVSSGSGSEPWNHMTNPSSENSSLERARNPMKLECDQQPLQGYPEHPSSPQQPVLPPDERGYPSRSGYADPSNGPTNGFINGAGPTRNPSTGYFQQTPQQEMPPPAVPPKYAVPRKGVTNFGPNLGRSPLGPAPTNGMVMGQRPAQPPQRKSWLKRTFSRKG